MSTRPSKQDAERCRRLAREAGDERTRRILLDLAAEHETMANPAAEESAESSDMAPSQMRPERDSHELS